MRHLTPGYLTTAMTTNRHLSCTAIIQGGARRPVLAIGRLGKKRILVRYRIKDGSVRERWLPSSRVFDLAAVEVLPPYVRKGCDGGGWTATYTELTYDQYLAVCYGRGTVAEIAEARRLMDARTAVCEEGQSGCPCGNGHRTRITAVDGQVHTLGRRSYSTIVPKGMS